MNTHGHESVARTAGIPILTAAFERGGRKAPRLTAILLGNWLTDVSQLVDPVATAAGGEAMKKVIDQLLDEVGDSVYVRKVDKYLQLVSKINLEKSLAQLKEQLRNSIDFYVLDKNDTRQSQLATLIRTSFRIQGYFKFAHPGTPRQDPPMDTDAFFKVFDAFYTQYFPNEHLDRPEILPAKKPPEFEAVTDIGTRAQPQNLTPDLYKYLRDDMEMVAGLLTEVDLEWGSKTFQPGGAINDADPEWNLKLAELGHALHAVEDFFAHSNFVEHVSLLMGKEFLPKKLELTDQQVFLRRLKKYEPVSIDDWTHLPDEDFIVTGYFDMQDTMISIAHLAEALIGLDAGDPLRHISEDIEAAEDLLDYPNVPIYQAQQLFTQTLEFLHDPNAATANKDNAVAKKFADMKDRIASDYAKVKGVGSASREVSQEVGERLFKDFPLFQQTDPRIKNDVLNYIVLMTRGAQVGKDVITAYKAVKNLAEFFGGPLEWVTAKLSEKLKDLVKDAIIFYARERALDMIGQNRIGCHSLLAKDHGGEWLYKHMKDCAISVHWEIVTALTRWSDPKWRGANGRPEDAKWVNWLELLEFYLRHPRSAEMTDVAVTVPVDIVHVVEDTPQHSDSLASLTQKYRKTAVHRETFSWETIANANFATKDLSDKDRKDVVNATLKSKHWGYPVHMKPNYAFKAGLRVIIPDQTLSVTLRSPVAPGNEWFRAVMQHGWEVFKGYHDPRTKESVAAIHPHELVYCKSRLEAAALVKRGATLIKKAEESYRPPASNR